MGVAHVRQPPGSSQEPVALPAPSAALSSLRQPHWPAAAPGTTPAAWQHAPPAACQTARHVSVSMAGAQHIACDMPASARSAAHAAMLAGQWGHSRGVFQHPRVWSDAALQAGASAPVCVPAPTLPQAVPNSHHMMGATGLRVMQLPDGRMVLAAPAGLAAAPTAATAAAASATAYAGSAGQTVPASVAPASAAQGAAAPMLACTAWHPAAPRHVPAQSHGGSSQSLPSLWPSRPSADCASMDTVAAVKAEDTHAGVHAAGAGAHDSLLALRRLPPPPPGTPPPHLPHMVPGMVGPLC